MPRAAGVLVPITGVAASAAMVAAARELDTGSHATRRQMPGANDATTSAVVGIVVRVEAAVLAAGGRFGRTRSATLSPRAVFEASPFTCWLAAVVARLCHTGITFTDTGLGRVAIARRFISVSVPQSIFVAVGVGVGIGIRVRVRVHVDIGIHVDVRVTSPNIPFPLVRIEHEGAAPREQRDTEGR